MIRRLQRRNKDNVTSNNQQEQRKRRQRPCGDWLWRLCFALVLFAFAVGRTYDRQASNVLGLSSSIFSVSQQLLAVQVGDDEESQGEVMENCVWYLIAGDSNSRHLTDDLTSLWSKNSKTDKTIYLHKSRRYFQNGSVVWQSPCPNTGFWWADMEYVILMQEHHNLPKELNNSIHDASSNLNSTCHILSLRFLQNQNDTARLANNIMNTMYCDTHLEDMDPLLSTEGYKRPSYPDFMYISHGLWGLPNAGTHTHGLDCRKRFQDLIPRLKHWQNSSHVVWVTNFQIDSHATIRNDYLRWEIACQKQMAELHAIPILDPYELLRPLLPTKQRMVGAGDYHLTQPARDLLARSVATRFMPSFRWDPTTS